MADTPYCILIHYHEISLKGKNRSWFEKRLLKNIRKQLRGMSYSTVQHNAARVFCFGVEKEQWNAYSTRLKRVMGIKHATLMSQISAEMDCIIAEVLKQLRGKDFNSFRISARRQYKEFSLTSQEINEEIGTAVISTYNKTVNLKHADIDVMIQLIKGMAYVGCDRIYGYGGLPVGCSEEAVSMISSGIDSPVASFEMLKRGVDLTYVHFHSAPATNRQSIRNVKEILKVLAAYQIRCKLHLVPLFEIQQRIMAEAPNKLWVILFRRAMVKLACMLADKEEIPALVSGESVGQVASQTLSNIRATSDAGDRPILRPLAGMNKDEIVEKAEKIGSYEISIEPYDDCCSFFIPMHPETKADLDRVRKTESGIEFGNLFQNALENTEFESIDCGDYKLKKTNMTEAVHD